MIAHCWNGQIFDADLIQPIISSSSSTLDGWRSPRRWSTRSVRTTTTSSSTTSSTDTCRYAQASSMETSSVTRCLHYLSIFGFIKGRKFAQKHKKLPKWRQNTTNTTSGQSYKGSTIVNYDSRVVIWGIFQSGMTLESLITIVGLYKIGHRTIIALSWKY